MTLTPLDKQLLELETRYWRAIKDKDVDAALQLTDDPCTIVGSSGAASIDARTFAQMMQGARWEILDFTIDDAVQVRLLLDEVAVIAYKVREELIVEGAPVTLEAADSSVWVHRQGRWLCAVHTQSVLGDPFGRDRKPAS